MDVFAIRRTVQPFLRLIAGVARGLENLFNTRKLRIPLANYIMHTDIMFRMRKRCLELINPDDKIMFREMLLTIQSFPFI